MKLAITSSSTEFDAPLEARFGRCKYFIIVDSGTRDFRALPNPAADSQHGAGTQAAQFIANQGVGAVISGSFGPNAFSVLESAGVKMYEATQGSIEALFESFLAGQLKQSREAKGQKGRRGA